MSASLAPPPLQTPIVVVDKSPGSFPGQMTKVFADWLRSLVDRAQDAAFAVMGVTLPAQTASIAATSLVPVAFAGLYRVSYEFRVTTPASVSSSLQVDVLTTESGIACTQSSAAYTGNSTSAPQSGAKLVNVDGSTPIQFVVTYASVGTAMEYGITLVVEQL